MKHLYTIYQEVDKIIIQKLVVAPISHNSYLILSYLTLLAMRMERWDMCCILDEQVMTMGKGGKQR